jgi:heme O synthase-like polyprenyltransferase
MELKWYQWVGFLIFFTYTYLILTVTTSTPRENYIINYIMIVIGFLIVLVGWFETRKNKEKNNKRSKWKIFLYSSLYILMFLFLMIDLLDFLIFLSWFF